MSNTDADTSFESLESKGDHLELVFKGNIFEVSENDPGLFFEYADEQSVHACLHAGAGANVLPVGLMPGVNAAASVLNLRGW
jgi:hypothetical protein